ncbi:hypothetical protein GCM10010329_75910 [Streptomyces spiroverticillatus]|uniref:Integral membrane protein n=1 Tax=Streptomyces finlayi TaxID=67296 RepID=A0A919CER6_9ACTN|nr:hypothetical protein [Streptomyces finlayi]GHA41633.1 hypothetical protein GCM10010329_75910 [Streptomyces spiroverticillatus]GHD16503.1 hypothetical protein GCM10010334_77560 [Streptomyces finlayi]
MPGPGLTPPRSQPSTGVLVTLRVVFVVLTLFSCGLLSWAAMLRIAVVRRRRADWVLFGLALALSVALFITIGVVGNSDPDAPLTAVDWVCLLLLFAMAAGVTTHYLVADINHFSQPVPASYAWGTAPGAAAGPGQPTVPYGYPQQQPTAGPSYGYPPVQQQPPVPQPVQPPVQPPTYQQPPVQQPQPRIHQVRAELDELSELLRKEPRDGRGDGGQPR